MVVFLSAGMLDGLQAALLQGAYTPDTRRLVYQGHLARGKVVRCRLGALAQAGREKQYLKNGAGAGGGFPAPIMNAASCTTLLCDGIPRGEAVTVRLLAFTQKGHGAGPAAGGGAIRRGRALRRRLHAGRLTADAFANADALLCGRGGHRRARRRALCRNKASDPAVVAVDECAAASRCRC